MASSALPANIRPEIARERFSLAQVNVGKKLPRIPQLDALRGFLLVWMTLTHLPTRVSAYSNQALGFVSAAEGFILLAAILVGRIQLADSEKYGTRKANGKLRHRVARIYGYHLALLAFAFSVGGALAVYAHRVPLRNLLDFYLEHPKEALIAAPALLYNPPLLDILPMYIVFMLVTPVILRCAEKWGWRAVLAASGFLWLLDQFHLREAVYAVAGQAGFSIPLNETGAFDLFGWQFMWTAGLWLGSARSISSFAIARIPKWLVVLCATIAAAVFAARHTSFELLTGPALFDVLVNKWRLGILRVVDATAIGVLLVRFGSALAETRLGRRLAVLGCASLEVFSSHVVFCLIVLGLASGTEAHFAPWQDAVVLATTISGLFFVAGRVSRTRQPGAPTLTLLTVRGGAVYHPGSARH